MYKSEEVGVELSYEHRCQRLHFFDVLLVFKVFLRCSDHDVVVMSSTHFFSLA